MAEGDDRDQREHEEPGAFPNKRPVSATTSGCTPSPMCAGDHDLAGRGLPT